MTRRKTSLTRVSAEALKKIEQLKEDSGKTSAQIIDDALNLDKDDPTVNNIAKVAKKLGMTPEQFRELDMPVGTQENLEYFHKLRREYRKAFMREMQSNPKFITLDNTKPPNAYIDACILSLWGKASLEQMKEVNSNSDYEDFLRTRGDIIRTVYYQCNKPIDGISWGQFHKAWFKSYGKYKGKFEQTIDNRIYALIRNKIIKPSNDRGQYILYRELTDDENIIIEGILRLQPQRGIVIPNFWKRTRLVA